MGFEGLKEKKRKERKKKGGGCESLGVSIAAAAPSDQCWEQVGPHPHITHHSVVAALVAGR